MEQIMPRWRNGWAKGCVAGLLAALAATGVSAQDGTKVELPADQVEAIVRDYLMREPEIIYEALQELQRRETAAEAERRKIALTARKDDLFNSAASPVGGNPEGDVTLVEFFDYNCPCCRRVAPTMVQLERADPDLRLVYKEFPILGPGSEFAARAALAARKQGKYVAFHNALMRTEERLAENEVMAIARAVGLDTERLRADMADPGIQAAIARNRELARALGVTGTPGFVIGDAVVPGAADPAALRDLVARARQAEAARGRPPGG
jgi:protein-disulfide isomerase